jgi:hypothetical protein
MRDAIDSISVVMPLILEPIANDISAIFNVGSRVHAYKIECIQIHIQSLQPSRRYLLQSTHIQTPSNQIK